MSQTIGSVMVGKPTAIGFVSRRPSGPRTAPPNQNEPLATEIPIIPFSRDQLGVVAERARVPVIARADDRDTGLAGLRDRQPGRGLGGDQAVASPAVHDGRDTGLPRYRDGLAALRPVPGYLVRDDENPRHPNGSAQLVVHQVAGHDLAIPRAHAEAGGNAGHQLQRFRLVQAHLVTGARVEPSAVRWLDVRGGVHGNRLAIAVSISYG